MREFILMTSPMQTRWIRMSGLHLGDVVQVFPGTDFPHTTVVGLAQWVREPKMFEIFTDNLPSPVLAHEDETRYELVHGLRIARITCMLCPNTVEHVYDFATDNAPEAVLCKECGGKGSGTGRGGQ